MLEGCRPQIWKTFNSFWNKKGRILQIKTNKLISWEIKQLSEAKIDDIKLKKAENDILAVKEKLNWIKIGRTEIYDLTSWTVWSKPESYDQIKWF